MVTRLLAVAVGLLIFGSAVTALVAIWTGDVRWFHTAAVLAGAGTVTPFLAGALVILWDDDA